MRQIATNSALIKELKENNALLDAKMTGMNFSIKPSGSFAVQLDFEPRQGSYKENLRLEFNDIKEFAFYYDDTSAFYYLERYKLFSTADGDYYFSMDPSDEYDILSEEDQGVIRAKQISGILL
jgi:antitoxin component YwqK of YwqJK toxin-antitoxin module